MDKIPNPFKKKEGESEPNPVVAGVTDTVNKAMNETYVISEKAVKAVDPLHLFDPSPIPTRLVLEKGLFNRSDFNPYPIVTARSNEPFHNLEIKGKTEPSDFVIMEDATSKAPVLLIDRTPEPRIYDIYKTSPMTEGQKVATTINGQDVYMRAKVLLSGEKDLQVFMEGQDEPTYTITKAPGLMNFSTAKVINMVGHGKVASLSNWDNDTYMLEVTPGLDAALMMCLAIIADDNTE